VLFRRERTLTWQLQVKQMQNDLDMALRLHKSEKEEAEYHHLILVQENGDLLRETAAALEGVTRLEDLLQRSKSEQKTMLEQMESLRVELKMHVDTILPSQHQRMLELASHMHRLQECAATARKQRKSAAQADGNDEDDQAQDARCALEMERMHQQACEAAAKSQ
jgi:hypothetical protein